VVAVSLPLAGVLAMFFLRVKHIGQADPREKGMNQRMVHDISSHLKTSNNIFTSRNTGLIST
jgi:hypothetical protein